MSAPTDHPALKNVRPGRARDWLAKLLASGLTAVPPPAAARPAPQAAAAKAAAGKEAGS
jgi:hypothetical protein